LTRIRDVSTWNIDGSAGRRGNPHRIWALRVAKHSKGTAAGVRLKRPNIRLLNLGNFTKLSSVAELLDRPFGDT
jgi:hypothetical protein